MKFVTLENKQIGIVIEDQVVDFDKAIQLFPAPFSGNTMLDIIYQQAIALEYINFLIDKAKQGFLEVKNYNDIIIHELIPNNPRNIFCLGKNYQDHAKEMQKKLDDNTFIPEHPIFFTKASTAIIAAEDTIPAHKTISQQLDYEAELAIVIGKKGINIKKEQAWDYVFGYTAINDITARDLQKKHQQWFKAKSLDGFAPIGPVLAHISVMPQPQDITIQCKVNGELRQKATLDQLIFSIPEIIESLSQGMTLLPGDIIATGTPAGVGMALNPPKYLQVGDEILIEITGLKPLVNWVGE